MNFEMVLSQRAQGIVLNALPENQFSIGFGETLKQARANAVAFAAATPLPFKYTFYPFRG